MERRKFMEILSKSVAGISALGTIGTLDTLLGCTSHFQDTPAIEKPRPDQAYIILIDSNEDMKDISKVAGYKEEVFGHIEFVYKDISYGVGRGPEVGVSRSVPLDLLEDIFQGVDYEVIELDISNPRKAVQYFSNVLKGTEYNNPAQMIIDMCNGSGNILHGVYPIAVETIEKTNNELKEAMEAKGIAIPNNGFVYLPEQFRSCGVTRGTGIFGQDKR